MKKNQILFPVVAIVALLLTACQKSENDPLASLCSRTELIANNWRVARALDKGSDVTSDCDKYELSLTKAGSVGFSAKYKFVGTPYECITTGTWAFVNNMEKIALDFDDNAADGAYRILRLKGDEMWLRKEGETVELHFVLD